jgi:hypothetical protein
MLFYLASDAKERQKWIDKLRTCSGSNAANVVSIDCFVLIVTTQINYCFYS